VILIDGEGEGEEGVKGKREFSIFGRIMEIARMGIAGF
jgi:hypothetical protein